MNRSFILQRIIIIFLAIFLIIILAASLIQRFIHPDLTVKNVNSTVGNTAASQTESMGEIAQLMQYVAKNPDDRERLLQLVEALLAIGEWQSAENFAQRALALDPIDQQNPRTLYLLALAHHNKGEHEQAAELLEKLLEQTENPSARYSLGILYLYFLNKPESGITQLKKGLEVPKLPEALKDAMESELLKAKPQIKEEESMAQPEID